MHWFAAQNTEVSKPILIMRPDTKMDQNTSIHIPLFSLEPTLGIVERTDFLCRSVAGRRVLHIGCADYPLTIERMTNPDFLHRRLCDAAQYCVGLDASQEALQAMRQTGFTNLIEGDACQLSKTVQEKFDLLVAGEVIEHLSNPGLFFEEAARCLTPGGAILITVPNAFNIFRIFHLLRGREVVHKDHCFYFSAKTLAHLASRSGFVLEKVGYTDPLAGARWRPILSRIWKRFIRRFPVFGQSVVAVLRVGNPQNAKCHVID